MSTEAISRIVIPLAILVSLGVARWSHGVGPHRAADRPGDRVLAEVEGSPIYESDVEAMIASTFSEAAESMLDDHARREVLESIVASRAIARARELELTSYDRAELDRELARKREDVLVRQYVDAHGDIEPVDDAMVRTYYAEHPERFGGGDVRTYDILFTTRIPTDPERSRVVAALGAAGTQPNWAAYATATAASGLPVAHRHEEEGGQVLEERLREVLHGLTAGQTSALTFVDGRAFVIRLVSVHRRPPRPLAEVGAEIRRTLAPSRLRDTVAGVRREVLAHTHVRYRGAAR